MKRLKIICKIAGKILTYFGLIASIGSALEDSQGLVLGIICIIVGCLLHELSEL